MRNIVIIFLVGYLSSFDSFAQNVQDSTNQVVNDTSLSKISTTKVDEIINLAKSLIGTPYVWGGITPSGFDCSGFINYIFGFYGYTLVRTSFNLAELGETVTLSNAQPGDLMFFRAPNNTGGVGHVGMVIEVTSDAILFIHSSSKRGVTISNFSTSKYYISHYVKTKRLD